MDKCPHCGSDWVLRNVTPTVKYDHFRCGSNYPGRQTEYCKDRQIAALEATENLAYDEAIAHHDAQMWDLTKENAALTAQVAHYKEAYIQAEERAYAADLLREENVALKAEVANSQEIVNNFWKAFGWIELSWLRLTPEEESALLALKEKGKILP